MQKKRGLANWGWENINFENTHAKMGLWDLTKQLHRAKFCSKIEICKSNQNEYEGPADFDWGLQCDVY